ncbi:MAG TPA: hypothetical protein VFS00_24230 [Polyangiaceae bacterium]|nr:hypothetical protein [Polyangiaceae bacterium]
MPSAERSPDRLLAGALAVAFGALAYPALRVASALVTPEPDPALVVWVTRNAYGARVTICAYVAALAWPVALRFARARPAAAARALPALLSVAFAALALQLALAP